MKKLIFLLVVSGVLTACGSDDPSAPVGRTCSTLQGVYTWNADPTETLTINNDCTFTDSLCGYTASYTVPDSLWGTVISVAGTNGTPGCMSSTAHLCTLEYTGTQLAVECDGGAVLELYNKQ